MENEFRNDNGSCPANCEDIRYTLSTNSVPLDPAEECFSSQSSFDASCRQTESLMLQGYRSINILTAERLR